MRILIAEDEVNSRRVLAAFLTPCGSVDIAVDGREAVEAFRRATTKGQPYDLICLDIMMPLMNGHEVLKTIRYEEGQRGVEEQDRVKVIMTTALNDEESRTQAFEEGCEAYINKPIDRRQILNKIRELGIFEEKKAAVGASE